MSLTPVEIRHVKLPRRPLGYDRKAADDLLARIVTSFEGVWRERADLRDELEEVENELTRQKVRFGTRSSRLSAWRTTSAHTRAARQA